MNSENIDVEISDRADGMPGKQAVVIDRKGGRAWTGEGATDSAAATEATRKFIGDRRAREYLPS